MTSLSVRVPASVPVEVVRAALAALGAQIVERVSRKVERDFPGMTYIKRFRNAEEAAKSGAEVLQDADGDWYEQREIDGVELAQRIRKMENKRAAELRRDYRECYSFPQATNETSTAAYVAEFCRSNNLT